MRSLTRRELTSRKGEPRAGRAAVLVPLCNVGGQPSVLFTVRTHRVSSHKGQVAFPGGYQDDAGEPLPPARLRAERPLRAPSRV